MPPSNESLVVVIAGASSGIGRATAHAFARRGASVVLAARRAEHPVLSFRLRLISALAGSMVQSAPPAGSAAVATLATIMVLQR